MILRMCDRCGSTETIDEICNDETNEAVISIKVDGDRCYKYNTHHLCKNCTDKLIEWIVAGRNANG